MAAVANLFERLSAKQTALPTTKAQKHPAQKLLDWLQHWAKPTVSAREICIYGPRPIRKREIAGKAAETLVKTGWLVPVQTHRYDMKAWQIVRRPILYPDCSRVAD
jgi:hypothetical protein